MANRYWVGGTGTWDTLSTTHWSATSGGAGGASVPGSGDDVFFDSASNATSYTVNFSAATLSFGSLNVSGPATGSVTIAYALGTGFQANGNVTIAATGVIWNWAGTMSFYNSTPATITTNGVALTSVTMVFNATGSWTLGSALTCAQVSVFNGTFSTSASNYALTTSGYLFPGGGTINLNGSTVSVGYIYTSGATGTINAGTSTLVVTGATTQVVPNYTTWYNATLSGTSVSYAKSVDPSTTISNTLTVWGPGSAGYITCSLAGTIGAIATTNTTPIRRLIFNGSASVTTAGSSITDADFSSCTISTNTLTGTRLGNQLNNSGITFTSPKTVYWNLSGTQNWSATGWATASGGAPNVNNFPLPQDTAVFDNTGSAGTVTVDASWAFPTVDFSARTSAVTFNITSYGPTVYGDFTLGSGVTMSGSGGSLSFKNSTTRTLTSAGKSFTQNINFTAGSTQLGDALTTSQGITLTGGTFNTASYAVSSSTFNSTGSTARTLTLGTTTWTITAGGGFTGWVNTGSNLTVNSPSSTISLTSSGIKYFQPITGGTYGTIIQAGSGALTIYATTSGTYTLNSVKATTFPSTVKFSTYTFLVNNFELSGTAGNLVTLSSDSAGGAFTLSKVGGGIISCDYLSIRDSTVTGSGAVWYAGANSTNVSNNTGWIFTAAPTGGGMLFFFN